MSKYIKQYTQVTTFQATDAFLLQRGNNYKYIEYSDLFAGLGSISSLTSGYLPYYNGTNFANSPLSYNGTSLLHDLTKSFIASNGTNKTSTIDFNSGRLAITYTNGSSSSFLRLFAGNFILNGGFGANITGTVFGDLVNTSSTYIQNNTPYTIFGSIFSQSAINGVIKFANSTNDFLTGFQSGVTAGADSIYTMPTAFPAASGYVMASTDAGVLSWYNIAGSLAGYLPLTLAADTTVSLSTHNLTFDAGANTARIILNATNATDAKIFSFRTGNLQRWAFRVDGAGDDIAIRRYDNAGTFVDAPISIERATGLITASNYVNFLSGYGIDTTATAGSDILNIGTTNANVINIGSAGATVNILGAVVNEYATNAYVTDKLVTYNSGGGAATGIGVGFEIEENAIITGYFKTNAARNGFSILTPAIAYKADLNLNLLTADRAFSLPDVAGTIITTGDTGTVTNTMLAGSIAYSKLSAMTSANFASIVSDEVGTGFVVFNDSPTFTTQILTPLIYGSSALGGNATITSTSHSTKGFTYIGASTKFAFDEVNSRLGINRSTPAYALDVSTSGGLNARINMAYTDNANGFGEVSFMDTTSGNLKWGFGALADSAASKGNSFYIYQYRNAAETAVNSYMFEISNLGSTIIGKQTALATNATDGLLYIPNCAGNATGTPTSYTGKSAFVYNTTDHVLETYDTTNLAITDYKSVVSTQFDKTTDTTLADITGLTANVVAGKTYSFEATLYTTSNVAGGVKAAIAGTATATAIIYEGLTIDAGLTIQSRTTTKGNAVGAVTAVTNSLIRIMGTITVNAAGTLTVQFAQNAATGTSSILVGSTFNLRQIL